MIVWLSLVIFIIFLKLLMGNLREKKQQKTFLIISGIAVTIIMGFRYPHYDIVYDLSVYYNYYGEMVKTPWNGILLIDRFEPGYAVLNKVLATFIPWQQFIILFEAAVSVGCISRFIYKNSQYPFMGMLFYITLGTMTFQLTAFRQAFAISICLLSVEFIKSKQFVKFLLCILLAMTFHKTALVFIPFYFIANRKSTLLNNIVNFIVVVVCVYFSHVFIRLGNALFGMNFGGYIGNEFGGVVPISIYVITILFSITIIKKVKFNSITFNMTILGCMIYFMRYATLILERISFYYLPAVIVQLPNAINGIHDKLLRIIFNMLAIVLAIALFIYRLMNAEYGDYRFFWQ